MLSTGGNNGKSADSHGQGAKQSGPQAVSADPGYRTYTYVYIGSKG